MADTTEAKITINGVDIVQDGDITHFSISEDAKRSDEQNQRNDSCNDKSLWERICGWFKSGKVKPYVKVRDMADPFGDRDADPDDIDVGRDGAIGVEAGIKVSF